MAIAESLYEAGDLDGAVAAAAAAVKAKPTDAAARSFFVELLCFDGQIARGIQQLDVIGRLVPDLAAGAGKLRVLLEGEQVRRAVLAGDRLPDLFDPPGDSLELHLTGVAMVQGGDLVTAKETIDMAEETRAPVPGTCDGQQFEDLRDLDDVLGPVLEILTPDGRYLWVPFSSLRSIAFRPAERPRDLIWRAGELLLRDGRRGPVYVPALYPTPADRSASLKLGRESDWIVDGGPARGLGRKSLLIGDEDRDILSIDLITFGDGQAGEAPQ